MSGITGLTIHRDLLFGGHGRLTGDVVRARVAGDPAGSGDLFLSNMPVYLMALPEKVLCAEAVTDADGVVTFDWLLEGHEFAAFTRAAKLPDDSYVIGDYWDRLFPSPMP
jgi:hypothetical protein